MAHFPKEAVLRPKHFSSDSPPRLHLTESSPAVNSNSTCHFRGLSWTSNDKDNRRLPLLLQSSQPVELHRGITHSEYAAGDQSEQREVIALSLRDKTMCPSLLSTMRHIEKLVESELKAQGDRGFLARQTKPGRADAQAASILWVPLKAAYPCATLCAESDSKTIQEVPASKFHELSGRYFVTIQANSLYQPRVSTQWRIAYCVRSLVLVVSKNDAPLEMTACLEDQLPGFRFVQCNLRPAAQDSGSTIAAASQTESRATSPRSTPSTAKTPRPRKPPAATRKRSKQHPATDTNMIDWVETPPVKRPTSSGRTGSRVPSKDLAFAKQLAREAEAATNEDDVSSVASDADSAVLE